VALSEISYIIDCAASSPKSFGCTPDGTLYSLALHISRNVR